MGLCASARTTVQLAYCIRAWLWVCVLVASFHVKHCDRLLPCGRLFLCFALGGLRRRLLLSCSPSRAERSAAPAQHSTTTTGPGPSTTIDTGTTKILRVLSAGEGFAGQNSKTLLIGIGTAENVKSIEVRWPFGEVQYVSPAVSGDLIHLSEDEDDMKRTRY